MTFEDSYGLALRVFGGVPNSSSANKDIGSFDDADDLRDERRTSAGDALDKGFGWSVEEDTLMSSGSRDDRLVEGIAKLDVAATSSSVPPSERGEPGVRDDRT